MRMHSKQQLKAAEHRLAAEAPRSHDALVYIRRFQSEHGHFPDIEDIRRHMGYRQSTSIFDILFRLSERGLLSYEGESYRPSKLNWRLVEEEGA